ncbi:MAG: 4-hydroxy-tetrahydrodipicolinate synthase [Acidimicrobiales bacterium]
MEPLFGRVLTALVTPFGPDGALDYDVARDVARFVVDQGSEGLVVGGSTGEGSSLTDDEKLSLFAAVAEAVAVPVLAGSTFASTRASVSLTAQVRATGVAGVLATTPAYARPSQAGLIAHLGAVAESTPLPVMLYDIPARTGRKIAPATTVELCHQHSNIVALKDASGDLAAAARLKAQLGDRLDLYSGDDSLTLPFLAVGAVGVVSVAAHWAGAEFAAMLGAVERDKWSKARKINERLGESYAFESSEAYPNPMPTKAALRFLGFAVGECRLPHPASDPELNAAAARVVGELQATRA